MASRSIDERIDDLQKKQAQLKAQEKALKAKKSQAERKARTKRLIEVGAILEKAMEMEFETQEDKDKLLRLLTEEKSDQSGATYTIGSWLAKMFEKQQ